jgi:hypothetical protein
MPPVALAELPAEAVPEPAAVLACFELRGGERDAARFEPLTLLSLPTLSLRPRESELAGNCGPQVKSQRDGSKYKALCQTRNREMKLLRRKRGTGFVARYDVCHVTSVP